MLRPLSPFRRALLGFRDMEDERGVPFTGSVANVKAHLYVPVPISVPPARLNPGFLCLRK